MELLLVIVAVSAFLLLVKHAKANGRFSERTLTSRPARKRLRTSNAKVSDCAATCRCNSKSCSASSPSTTLRPKRSTCELKREAQLDNLAQGARNRLEKAQEKSQSAMVEANQIVGIITSGDRITLAVKNLIEGVAEPHRPLPSPLTQILSSKCLKRPGTISPFTPTFSVSIRVVDFYKLRKF
ncbi:hypothetical protein [Stutzerimonas nitrititolerans]|uniref:hypothetical protein n=1 Tax=Stutzerimonas nitrititolerans TaxID=2482751 RepID=UPI0028AF019E|nr:hypothetical protein [Stutzerimonas nitrititolerans]